MGQAGLQKLMHWKKMFTGRADIKERTKGNSSF